MTTESHEKLLAALKAMVEKGWENGWDKLPGYIAVMADAKEAIYEAENPVSLRERMKL